MSNFVFDMVSSGQKTFYRLNLGLSPIRFHAFCVASTDTHSPPSSYVSRLIVRKPSQLTHNWFLRLVKIKFTVSFFIFKQQNRKPAKKKEKRTAAPPASFSAARLFLLRSLSLFLSCWVWPCPVLLYIICSLFIWSLLFNQNSPLQNVRRCVNLILSCFQSSI